MSKVLKTFSRRRWLWAWMLVSPALIVLALTAAYPLVRTFWFGFTNAFLSDIALGYDFVGLENYALILKDPDWWTAVYNTLWFSFFSVFFELIFGLAIALILNQAIPSRGLLRASMLIPWAIPTVVSATMWAWMFNDLYGVINYLFLKLPFVNEAFGWLVEDELTMGALIFVDVWKTTPFMTLLILAGLQSIPQHVMEAAKIDSKSAIQRFFFIVLPLLKPAIVVAVLFRALDALRIFDLVYVFTSNRTSMASVSVYARKQMIDFQEFGYGSAASVLIFLMIFSFTLVYLKLTRAKLVEAQ